MPLLAVLQRWTALSNKSNIIYKFSCNIIYPIFPPKQFASNEGQYLEPALKRLYRDIQIYTFCNFNSHYNLWTIDGLISG